MNFFTSISKGSWKKIWLPHLLLYKFLPVSWHIASLKNTRTVEIIQRVFILWCYVFFWWMSWKSHCKFRRLCRVSARKKNQIHCKTFAKLRQTWKNIRFLARLFHLTIEKNWHLTVIAFQNVFHERIIIKWILIKYEAL